MVSNKVIHAKGVGVEVGEKGDPGEATGNVLRKNKVTQAKKEGFLVSDGGNTLRNNRATKSGMFDLHDDSGSGTNVYQGNKFQTELIE